jgi:hypothetical protein
MASKIQVSQSTLGQLSQTSAIVLCLAAKSSPSAHALVSLQNWTGFSFSNCVSIGFFGL